MVLAGGPDRERSVSLLSGDQVSAALGEAGHDVRQCDVLPGNLGALDQFTKWRGDVVFPVLHGGWGEGGGLQRVLEERRLPFVGCGAEAADLAMDKHRAKQVMLRHGLPTPPFEVIGPGQRRTVQPPLVLKPPREGSSIDTFICPDRHQARRARSRLGRRHARLLVEKFIQGRELTVGVLADGPCAQALPPIQIVPATDFYDFDAKYERDDTRYLFDIDLPADTLNDVRALAVKTHNALGCRHLGRVDFIVDSQNRPWILEINTIPGFTTHSLLPMAAAKARLPLPQLVDRLARLAASDPGTTPSTLDVNVVQANDVQALVASQVERDFSDQLSAISRMRPAGARKLEADPRPTRRI